MIAEERVLFRVPEGIRQVRADKVLAGHFKEMSRELIQTAFEAKKVWIEGTSIRKSYLVDEGQYIEICLPKIPETVLLPVDMPLSILHEDNDIVVINKRAGQVVHPGHGTGEDTLVHALLHHTGGKLSGIAGELRPGVVHRLDKDTSGIVIFAKTDKAYLKLIKQFSEREIQKEYLAVVLGVPRLLSGSIYEPIERHRVNRVRMAVSPTGKPAHTDWQIEKAFPYQKAALLKCWLHTGRTHQIRVHLSWMGHPIVGDRLYGWMVPSSKEYRPTAERFLLHAQHIEFMHPVSEKVLKIEAGVPEDFKKCLENLQVREKELESLL